MSEHVDVVVVGAGLSGIGAGYRLRTECPDLSVAILEARSTMGGTWDLFRYPGVRSDSDMYTLGYSFKPWKSDRALADGGSILSYIQETAAEFGIDELIRYDTKVVGADWSTADERWTLDLLVRGEPRTVTCSFLYSCSGYYDYDEPYRPVFPGAEDFAGQIVHPQFWPDQLDYRDKNVVIVGSGATAVTLVPAMADEAAHVTMLQRSPTWIAAVPGVDPVATRVRALLPERLAHQVLRTKNIGLAIGVYEFCQRQPARARRFFTGLTTRALRDPELVAEHFTPTYDPWDQRLCAIPDADLFKAMRRGQASVATGHIERFVPEGIELTSGEVLPADIIVTATGLKLLAFGGIAPSIDGEPVDLTREFVWQGAMITGLPNFAVCIGYTNASWTLRADLTHRLVCKVLTFMKEKGYAGVVPTPDRELEPRPLLDLAAGYVQRSIADFPRQGDSGPWRVRQNYVLDAATTLRRPLARTLRPASTLAE